MMLLSYVFFKICSDLRKSLERGLCNNCWLLRKWLFNSVIFGSMFLPPECTYYPIVEDIDWWFLNFFPARSMLLHFSVT